MEEDFTDYLNKESATRRNFLSMENGHDERNNLSEANSPRNHLDIPRFDQSELH